MFDYLRTNDGLRIEVLSEQLCIGGAIELAQEIDQRGELMVVPKGTTLIEQNTETRRR